MELKQAQGVIIDALNKAILKGCYDIHDAKNIVVALDVILAQPHIEFGEITNE
jgi:hypothetical protein